MNLVLIHGMGRTPMSMLLLRHRLQKAGHRVYLFGYSATFESLEHASIRLLRLIDKKSGTQDYALVGHSLGAVIIRHSLPRLEQHPPSSCFLLAPPMVACRAARFFSRYWIYRLLFGEMGQLLAKDDFMRNLPLMKNMKLYAGTSGPRVAWLPFGSEANDGLLSVSEASGTAGVSVMEVPSTHTFIMNSGLVCADIASTLKSLA